MEKKVKEEIGITLVALVITIIVMLIIAGVAISAITTNKGLFGKASYASKEYRNSALNEAEDMNILIGMLNNYGNGTQLDEKEPKHDGTFDIVAKVNSPDTSKLPLGTTKYITWAEENQSYEPQALKLNPLSTSKSTLDGIKYMTLEEESKPYELQTSDKVPENWYDYDNGKWANIKSTSNGLEAYWVWIPRFAYKLLESDEIGQIDVTFIQGKGTIGANGETCYYATDVNITTDGSGLYSAKAEGAENKWIIHPAFWWDKNNNGVMEEGEQLAGIWVGKYQASSSTPLATDGGGNTSELQVQIKPNVSSWRNIQLANAFTACENIKKQGGAIGNNSSAIDTHLMKNMEWGAVVILSQSKYGIYNPQSATGVNGDKTYKIWPNSNDAYKTGQAGSKDAGNLQSTTSKYNEGNGPKASTTGTTYGVYDMNSITWSLTAALMESSSNTGKPIVGYDKGIQVNTGFTGKLEDGQDFEGLRNLPDKKYYDLYAFGSVDKGGLPYSRAKIGDATAETNALSISNINSRLGAFVFYVTIYCPIFHRGVGGFDAYSPEESVDTNIEIPTPASFRATTLVF